MTETLHTPRPSELVEHFLAEAISNSPQPLKDLADFLSSALSEDDWKTADRLLLALALRNRTSEPAREAVAWRARMRPDGEWMVLDAEYVPGRSADGAVEVQPLYTHPAPATADKLPSIDQLYEMIAGEVCVEPDFGDSIDMDSVTDAAKAVHAALLAALNEQPQ